MSKDDSWSELDREQRRARRREYRKKKERRLDRYRDHLDRVELDEEEDADLYARITDIRQSKRELRGRLQDLYDASDHEWDDVRDDFDDSWDDFQSDWEDVAELIEGRIDSSEDES